MAQRHQDDYDLLVRLANVAEAGGLAKERSVLLLWYLRNVVGLDDLDAYDYICDGDLDGGVDALYLETEAGEDVDKLQTLVLYQSKYTQAPTNVGERALDGILATANKFRTHEALSAFLGTTIEPALRRLIKRFDIETKVRDGWFSSGRLKIRVVLVTSGLANGALKRAAAAANARESQQGFATVQDITLLGPLVQAVRGKSVPVENIEVCFSAGEVLVIGKAPSRIAIAAVPAMNIVEWSGLETRELFELNVRRELRKNRVRDQLDAAISRASDHPDFLAYHNGLAVVCDSFEITSGGMTVRRPSVVNGAQSTIAFARAHGNGLLTPDLRVFVKFVEVADRMQLAQEISRRSNTQNPVNARNLVANSGPQRRLETEFNDTYPEYTYGVKPDATLDRSHDNFIANDDAAQLMCAIYNEMPWLAVKRTSLFESENHAMIFGESVHPAHIILAHKIGQRVDDLKDRFPDVYRRSWRLTRIVGAYLTGQVMRVEESPLPSAHVKPDTALADPLLEGKLNTVIKVVASTLKQRRDRKLRTGADDDFNVQFKNERVLRELRDQARDNYIIVAGQGD